MYSKFVFSFRLPVQRTTFLTKKRILVKNLFEYNALNSWKISIFNIIEKRISFYSKNLKVYHLNLFFFRHLKQGIQQFHEKFVLAPADKASNIAIVV